MFVYNQELNSRNYPWIPQNSTHSCGGYIRSNPSAPHLTRPQKLKTLTRENKAFLRSLGFKVK